MQQPNNQNEIQIEEDPEFSYEGFQVVRGEFFAHVYEPSFTFNGSKVSVNTACIKKLPQYDYVQILVNPDTKKLAVKPCREDEKDSFRWCSATTKRSPKQITCRVFFAKVMELMNWNPKYRYKLLGKLIRLNDELLFVFDLNSAEIYQRSVKDDGKETTSRTPTYPEAWKTQFGVPVEDHIAPLQVNSFQGLAVFSLQNDASSQQHLSKPTLTNTEGHDNDETHYEQLNFSLPDNPLPRSGSEQEQNQNTQSDFALVGQS